MIRVFLLLLTLFSSEIVFAAKGNGAPSSAATMQSGQRFGSSGGGSARAYADRRNAPPLDPGRKVTEQDCSKPVDLFAGNLKCK